MLVVPAENAHILDRRPTSLLLFHADEDPTKNECPVPFPAAHENESHLFNRGVIVRHSMSVFDWTPVCTFPLPLAKINM
jgi:hypothetical protein